MVLSGLPFSMLAQGDNEIYSQPTLGISHKGNGIYTINNSMEIRNFAYRKKQWEARTRHVDLIHFSNFEIADHQNISFGGLYRFAKVFDNSNFDELRLSQQYSFRSKPNILRYGFRVRLEERIRKIQKLTIRLRIRHSFDFPLSGQKLDIGEHYFLAHTETVVSMTGRKRVQYDQRTTLGIGQLLKSDVKLQFLLQHRIVNFLDISSHQLFLIFGSYLSL